MDSEHYWWHEWPSRQTKNPKFKHSMVFDINCNLVSIHWVDYLGQIKYLQQTVLNRQIFKGCFFCCLNYSFSLLIIVSILKYSLLFHACLSPYYSFSFLFHALTHLTSKNWIVPCSFCSSSLAFVFQSCLFSWASMQCSRGNLVCVHRSWANPNMLLRMSVKQLESLLLCSFLIAFFPF